MWSAWDYLGEVGGGAWSYERDGISFTKPYPWLLADMGVFDILGNPNGEVYQASAVWHKLEEPKIVVQPVNRPGIKPAKSAWRGTNGIPSWSWKDCEGNGAVVEVYFEAYKIVLLLNDKKIGQKKVKNCKASFMIRYKPGKLEAVAYDRNGNVVGRNSLISA